jgi:hypothetical protein
MDMKLFYRALLLCVALSLPLAGASGHTQDGWPLPWPFPWAKECPMNWDQLDGTYLLSDSNDAERLVLRINVLTKRGMRLIHVTRYSDQGRILFDGTSTVTEKQKVIGLWLNSMSGTRLRVWAIIKMHYQTPIASCAVANLIPILTVQAIGNDGPPDGVDYKMVKVDKN